MHFLRRCVVRVGCMCMELGTVQRELWTWVAALFSMSSGIVFDSSGISQQRE